MSISLYDCSVASFLQVLGAVSGFLDKGLAYCRDNGIDPESVVETRIFDDMQPFRFQIVSVAHHSRGALEGAKAGVFRPPGESGMDLGYAGLQGLVAEAEAALKALTPAEVDALAGKDLVFEIGPRRMPFRVEDFLLSFSTPNLHFHATTAYDILRSKGAPLGKRDYMGQMRLKA
jgi:hypothetical protein